MNEPLLQARPVRARAKSGWKRRVRLLFRLALRKLARLELVEMDEQGNPKVNPIRWF